MQTKTLNINACHEGIIHNIQYDYYGKRLATCSNDGKNHVFDVTGQNEGNKVSITNEQLENPHTGPIWKLSWAHPRFELLQDHAHLIKQL